MSKDVLNPLKTKHELVIAIDNLEYKITYKPLNKRIQAELDEFIEKQKETYESFDEKRAELKQQLEIKSLNEEIVKDVNLVDKAKIFFEQKEIVKKISILEKEIKDLGNVEKRLEKDLEDYYKKQFELCVVGDGKVAFQKAIDDAGISYSIINAHIGQALKEIIGKK
ncbi:hypothetical protein ACNSOL_01350 [Aliarcobacter lanthieri]|uniref:hypothetical protein n=1 Tax=Aliarcobacter lanthieri TaxID=1355374 RepID=UPI003AAB96F4